MRILQVNKFFFNRGGAERVFFNLCSLLEKKGHTVIPFSCNYPSTLSTPFQKYFIPPIVTEQVRFGGDGLATACRFLWSQQAALSLDRLLTDHPVEVAHLHNIYHQISPSILPVLARHRVPVVMTLHDFHLVSPAYGLIDAQGRDASYLKGHWHRALFKRSVKNSFAASALCTFELFMHRKFKVYEHGVRVFLAPSEFLARTIQEWGFQPRKLKILPNFINTEAFTAYAPPTKTVLYAGRLSEEKGIGVLLEVVERLPHIAFAIAGEGPLDGIVRAAAEKLPNLQWLGYVSPERMPEVYRQAGVVILPTIGVEVMPLAVLEAFAAGRAVIASDTGGIPELVKHQKTGLLVQRGNIDAFALAIQTLLSDAVALQEMGLRAREMVMKNYTPDRHYEQLMEIYQQVISTRSNGGIRELSVEQAY